MKIIKRKSGFTLVEMMVASVVTSFIILVAISGLAGTASSRSRIEEATLAADQLRYVADRIQQDFRNICRDRQSNVFEGSVLEDGGSRVRFRAISQVNARKSQSESDLYEIEYFLIQDGETRQLARRVCPVVGIETEPTETDGGILTKLSDQIVFFSVRYFDGSQWLNQWMPETQSLPAMVEISLAVCSDPKAEVISAGQVQTKQILMNFPWSGSSQELTTEQMEWEQPEDMTEEF